MRCRPTCARIGLAAGLLVGVACASSPAVRVPDAAALRDGHAAAWIDASAALRAGRARDALERLEPFVATEPWHVPTHLLRQDALRAAEGDAAVRSWYERAAAAAPLDGTRALLAARTQPRDARRRARAYDAARELDPGSPWGAIAVSSEALAEADDLERRAMDLLDRGFVAQSADVRRTIGPALDLAEGAARAAVQLGPELAEAHAARAEALLARRARSSSFPVAEALAAARQAVALDPTEPRFEALLSRALRSASDDPGAARALERALRLAPDDATLLAGLGRVRLDLGDDRGARSALERAVDRNPDDVAAWLNLGVALHRLGDSAGAVAAIRRAERLDADDPRILQALAFAYARAGRRADAAAAMEQCLAAGGAAREEGRTFIAEMRGGSE